MTKADKEGVRQMLVEAEEAVLKAIDRAQADSGVDMVPERHKVKGAFFQMRDRVNTAKES